MKEFGLDPQIKKRMIHRLHRIQGQLKGLERLIETEEDCKRIFDLLHATDKAFKGFSKEIFFEYLHFCGKDPKTFEEELKKILDYSIKM